MVFGSASPRAQDALFRETARRGLRIVSGRGIQTVGREAAARLTTSEAEALRLVREEIDTWHAADTGGDANTARLHVAIAPRSSLAVTPRTLKSFGELYDSARDRGPGRLGGARALDMEDRFGNFDVGKEADFVVDPSARDQTLFGLLMGTRETSIAGTYVQGRRLRP